MTTQLVLFPPVSDWRAPTTFDDFAQCERICIDIETYDPDLKTKGPAVRRGGYIVGIAIAKAATNVRYYPIDHFDGGNVDKHACLLWLRGQAKEFKGIVVGANLAYDLDYLGHINVSFPNATFMDVLIAEPIIDEQSVRGLDKVARKYLGGGKSEATLEDAARTYGVDAKSGLWRFNATFVGAYAEMDAVLPLQILDLQLPIIKHEGLEEVFKLECKLTKVLLAMRQRGIRVDLKRTESTMNSIQMSLTSIMGQLNRDYGIASCWDAAKIGRVLCDLGVPDVRTPTGKFTVTGPVLTKYADVPLCALVSQARQYDKTITTFLKGAILDSHYEGRVRPIYHQLRGEFGGTPARLSASHPNLQQIPSRDDFIGPQLRRLFIPEPGEVFERLDWSQIEYRFLAHYANGTGADTIKEEYTKNPDADFHGLCSQLAGISDRKQVKNVNFGVVYGAGVATTARTMGVSILEAEQFLRTYNIKLPFVRQTFYEVKRIADERGYIRNILNGRRRFNKWVPKRKDYDKPAQSKAAAHTKWGYDVEREGTYKALNALLQDSAAYLMKKAMVDIWESGVCSVLGAPLLSVHDELCFSRPDNPKGLEAMKEVHHIMETCMKLDVPIIAKRESGPNWGECR